MKKIITLIFATTLLFSCASKDDVVYFNGINSSDNSIGLDSYSPTYHIDDELVIIVNALDSEAARPFNKASVSVGTDLLDARGRERIQTYRVDSEGQIEFPVLGKIKIAGFNREQATIMLQEKLSDYIKKNFFYLQSTITMGFIDSVILLVLEKLIFVFILLSAICVGFFLFDFQKLKTFFKYGLFLTGRKNDNVLWLFPMNHVCFLTVSKMTLHKKHLVQ